MALFPQRVMLSSQELSDIVSLEASSVPRAQLLSWAHELHQARPSQGKGRSLSFLLTQLSQRAKRWRSSHVGDRYRQEVMLSDSQLKRAFETLMIEVQRAEVELHDPSLRAVLSWLSLQLVALKNDSMQHNLESPHQALSEIFERLTQLSHEFQERIFLACPFKLRQQLQQRVHELLERESKRSRPQDLIIAQRFVWWTLVEAELRLPPLRLRLFDQC